MPYLLDTNLDTNVVIRHLNGDPDTRSLMRTLAPHGIAISTVTQMEVWEGVYRTADPLDSAIAKRGARLRHELRQQGIRTRERALDLQIAATALHHGLELVTYNTHDYDDISELTLYWR